MNCIILTLLIITTLYVDRHSSFMIRTFIVDACLPYQEVWHLTMHNTQCVSIKLIVQQLHYSLVLQAFCKLIYNHIFSTTFDSLSSDCHISLFCVIIPWRGLSALPQYTCSQLLQLCVFHFVGGSSTDIVCILDFVFVGAK